jgi:hypothetical protein
MHFQSINGRPPGIPQHRLARATVALIAGMHKWAAYGKRSGPEPRTARAGNHILTALPRCVFDRQKLLIGSTGAPDQPRGAPRELRGALGLIKTGFSRPV